MRLALEINGEHICYAGLERSGDLSISIHGYHIDPADPEPLRKAMSEESSNDIAHIFIHGTHGYGKRMRDVQHVRWQAPEAKIGDEIVIRLLPNGEVSKPISDGPIGDLHFSPLISFGTLKKLYRLFFVHGVKFSFGETQEVKKDDK